MIRPPERLRLLILLPALCLTFGCPAAPVPPVPPAATAPPVPSGPGTTSTVQFPEGGPPILTRQLADKIQPGMAQEAVISMLIEAARAEPTANGMIEPIAAQSKLNPIRLDLTVSQGKRKLILGFKTNALVEKTQEGLD